MDLEKKPSQETPPPTPDTSADPFNTSGPGAQTPPGQLPLDNDSKNMAMFAHLGFVIGGFLVPLIIWLTQREKHSFIDYHGKEALNWQLTMLIFMIGGAILTIIFIGILVIIAAAICNLIFGIMAMIAASKGEYYKYPLNIRMIK